MTIDITLLEGLMLGLGLFAAPGPKDTLVIRQGVSGRPLWGIVAICIIADAILIILGVTGLAALFAEHRVMIFLLLLAGAAYLIWFGWQRLRAAFLNVSAKEALACNGAGTSFVAHLWEATKLSFLNPYAWLDTVILIGPMALAKPTAQQPYFIAGTMMASLAWFTLLAVGSSKASVMFRDPRAWRALDFGVALLMVYLVAGLFQDLYEHYAVLTSAASSQEISL